MPRKSSGTKRPRSVAISTSIWREAKKAAAAQGVTGKQFVVNAVAKRLGLKGGTPNAA